MIVNTNTSYLLVRLLKHHFSSKIINSAYFSEPITVSRFKTKYLGTSCHVFFNKVN